MRKGWAPMCSRCHIYQVTKGDSSLCFNCREDERWEKERMQSPAPQPLKLTKAEAEMEEDSLKAYCTACLSTLHRWESEKDGVRMCVKCRQKHGTPQRRRQLNPVDAYRISGPAAWDGPRRDPNGIR